MNKLIVIPARGGSKGIPLKNITLLNGRPLLTYTLEVALKANLKDTDIVVSTESEEIKRIASCYNGINVIDRPYELAGDTVSTEAVLMHAITIMEKKEKRKYEAVLTLQPTSPLRNSKTLELFVEKYENNLDKFDALLSFTEDYTDFWVCEDEDKFQRLYPNAPRRRQDRKPLYKENSAYYITDIKALKRTNSVLGRRTGGFIISEVEGIDINEPIDLKIAKTFLEEFE